jgi:hypothetical protein
MTELRTTIPEEKSMQFLQRMSVLGRNINTSIRVNSERARQSILVSIEFPFSNELELFLKDLPEWGIQLENWSKFDYHEMIPVSKN